MDLVANFFEIIDELHISQSFETPMKEARVVGYNLCHQSIFQDWADSIRMTKDDLTKVILNKQEISVSTFGNSQTKVKILFYGQSIQCEDLFATLQEKWQLLKTQFEAVSSNLIDTWDLDTCKVKFESLSASVLNIQSRLDTIDSRLAVIEEKLQSHCDHSDASASISNINSTNLQSSSSPEHQDHSEIYKFTSKTSVNSDLEKIMKAKRDDLSWIKMIRNKRIENISLTKMRKVRSILITGPTLPGKIVRRIARRLFGRDRLQTTKMIDFAAGYKVPTDRDRKRSFSMKETKSFIDVLLLIDDKIFANKSVLNHIRDIVNQYGRDIKSGRCKDPEDVVTDTETKSDSDDEE